MTIFFIDQKLKKGFVTGNNDCWGIRYKSIFNYAYPNLDVFLINADEIYNF